MNFRQTLSESPIAVGALAGGLLLIVALCIGFQMRGTGVPAAQSRAFFTIDDGKTWFADEITKRPPFQKDGKEAVRAYVYEDAKGTKFVNHLERFTPEAKQVLEESNKVDPKGKTAPDLIGRQGAFAYGREVKRPGETVWISTGKPREASKVLTIRSPSGATDATPVVP